MAGTTKAAAEKAAEKDSTREFEKDGHVLHASTPVEEINLRARGYVEKTSSK